MSQERIDGALGIEGVPSNSVSSAADTSASVKVPNFHTAQAQEKGYTQSSPHMGMQMQDCPPLYYMPNYNPYGCAPLMGVHGQGTGQQGYFASSEGLQHPVSYRSGPTAYAIPNFTSSMQTNAYTGGKFSNSPFTPAFGALNKRPPSSYGRGYHPTGQLSSTNNQIQQGLVTYNASMNMRLGNACDRYKCGEKPNENGNSKNSGEVICGPRAFKLTADSSVKEQDSGFNLRIDEYNLAEFQIEYEKAKFYVIKSYSEDDIHKSIKYDVWSSTPNGNKKLNAAYHDVEKTAEKCPILLFFSVNGSGQFVGLAEMIGPVDFNKDMDFWQVDKWAGFFPVKWHVVKDIPNSDLRHVILENNYNRSVTYTRDTQEIPLDKGLEMLKIFKNYLPKSSLFDDFNFYEDREKSQRSTKGNKPATLRMDLSTDGDGTNHLKVQARQGEKMRSKRINTPGSLVGLTKNLSLNG